jgi:SAM-dependent methyltransferase
VIDYYDPNLNRLITEQDIATLDQWRNNREHFICARDPKGFLIFIPPDQIQISDEYSCNDPYTVAESISSEFHARRISITIDLIRTATAGLSDFRVLDMGCGEGHITARIRESFPAAKIFALDHSISAISKGLALYPEIEFIVANSYCPPYCNDYFDVVVCNNLWEHVPDPLRLLASISRITKPSGYFVISTPSRYHLRNLLKVVRGRPVELISNLHVTEYSVGQVIEQLRYGGYEIINVLSYPISRLEGWRGFILAAIELILQKYLSLIGSHHNLQTTVFYLARKTARFART